MYYSYFGLQEAPFSIAVNPRYLYMSPSHRDALAHLLYGVGAGGGFILLTGEVGTGKTTINRCLIEQLPDNADLAIVLNPALDARDLLATVCEELNILPGGGAPGLKDLTDALHRFLLANHARGRKTVLLIDEAQHLSFEVLEQIRLLTNLETNEEKLLHIILIGQPELGARLARPELRQLNQRITARFDLSPLSRDETAAYIRHRLHVAGLPPGRTLFSERLVRAIHRESRGVPRLINLLCDRLLLGAYGRSADRPDPALLRTAIDEVLGGHAVPARRWHRAGLLLAVFLATGIVILALWALLQAPGGTAPPEGAAVLPPAPGSEQSVPGLPAVTVLAEEGGKEIPAAIPRWFMIPAQGAALLGTFYGADAAPPMAGDPCLGSRPPGVACLRIASHTWQRLMQDRRPALLRLVDSRRVEGRALFLGLDGDEVLLGTARGVERMPLATLGELWTGEAWLFWKRPMPIQRPLGPGDRGADVAAAAALFARLDGQERALGDGLYDARLEERVRLFQRAAGLQADGLIGERTLRALVLATGDDIDLARARRMLRGTGPGIEAP